MISDRLAREHIPANVTRLLELSGISQSELSRLADVNRMYISRVVNGEIMPNPAALSRIAEVFGVSSDDLMGDSVTMIAKKAKKKLSMILQNQQKHACSV